MDLFRDAFDDIVLPMAPKVPEPLAVSVDLLRKLNSVVYDYAFLETETLPEFRERLIMRIEQMMYVSGETAEPSHETTGMVEEIVRQQVIEMVCTLSLIKILWSRPV